MGVLGSLASLLFLGWIFGRIAERFTLPNLVGMLLAGICLGPFGFNLLNQGLLEISSALRTFALVVILLRAGLSLNKEILKSIKGNALALSVIPCLFEGFTVLFFARFLLGMSWIQGGLLGFILAAVSPAVVVPSMLTLQMEGYGAKKQIPATILAGATLDDVFAITLFSTFLLLASGQTVSILQTAVQIPWSILVGGLGGYVLGLTLATLFRKTTLRDWEKLILTLTVAILFWELSELLAFAGLLGIMTMGLAIYDRLGEGALPIASSLTNIWLVAQITLFSLVGTEVNVKIMWQAGLVGLLIICLGLVGRSVGVFVALAGADLTRKEKLFCTLAYLPKATVQAAMGGIPLSLVLPFGEQILAISALAILVTAPLGALAIRKSAPRLLERHIG